ncbi:MAG TPA: hypothetical protein VMF08_20085 [Candidatus Sulfotelmatobacter sp.]|nr:hypothetical protein [Candidatus Sulfotelmatobacter sp.]
MARIFTTRRVGKILICAVLAFFALQKVQGKDLYLVLLGPPSLRFEMTATNDASFSKELALPMPKDTKATVTILSTNLPAARKTRLVPAASTNSIAGKIPSGILGGAAKNANGRLNPANNLLSTMSQMINQDLKSQRPADDTSSYQPGDVIYVPAELNFVPPMPGQSRAIYRSR